MRDYFTWNGIASTDFDIYIEHVNASAHPERKIDVYQVPGRNGDIIFPQDAWNNFDRQYTVVAGDPEKNSAPDRFREIASWLFSESGYRILQDTIEGDYFYRAYFKGPMNVEELLSRYGRADITFSCRPERFLATGENTGTYTSSPITLTNPTQFKSKPLIYVKSNKSYPSLLRLTGRVEYEMDGFYSTSKNRWISGNEIIPGAGIDGGYPSTHLNSYNVTEDSITLNCKGTIPAGYDSRINTDGYYVGGCLGVTLRMDKDSWYSIRYDRSHSDAKIKIAYFNLDGSFTGQGENIIDTTKDGIYATGEYALIIFNPGNNFNKDVTFSNIQLQQQSNYGIPADEYTRWDGTVTGNITVNGQKIKLNNITDFINIDCDSMNIYRDTDQNRNNTAEIENEEFPVLEPGSNTITFEGNFEHVKITPRWWTI